MKTLIVFLLLSFGMLFAFKSDKPYVMYKGNKYYKCFTRYETDTIHEPAGFTVIKSQIIFYDHFKCEGL